MGLLMMVSGSKLLTTRSNLVTDHQNYLNQKAPNTHAEQTLPQGPAGKETEGSHYGSGSVRRCVSSLCPRSAALWSSERAPVLEGRSQHTERFSEGCHFKHVLYSKMQNSSECQNKQAIQKKTNLCKEVTTSECYALGPAKGSKRHVHSPVAGGGGSRGRLRGALITAAHYHVPPPAQLPSQPRPPRTEGTLTNTPGNPGG